MRRIFGLCLALVSAIAAAQVPVGDEFQVNSFTPGNQAAPGIAALEDGRFAIAWGGGQASSLVGRFFDRSGGALSEEFPLNAGSPGNHQQAQLADLGAGGFAAAWQSLMSPGDDSDGWSVLARVFDTNGQPLTDLFQVNTYTTNDQQWPRIAADATVAPFPVRKDDPMQAATSD